MQKKGLKAAHEIQVGMLPQGPNLIPKCDAVEVIGRMDGKATYVNAGHPPLLASLGGRPWIDIDAPVGLIAGVLDDTVYEAGKLTLRPGDSLVLYTDGVTEARDDDRIFYTQPRGNELMNNRRH
ncbi:MAG: PP2C family protein-serine/threonine phosphatase [Pseudomonadota bacterium]|nr:PP2C family protein-serine/threonine phosphatase [Pseudomonadota bacterium]